uniref:Uncharacterized protein n=1 Tax=Arundo donax TaxID=35708 RepID=A0A0A8Z393_ARUDO
MSCSMHNQVNDLLIKLAIYCQ